MSRQEVPPPGDLSCCRGGEGRTGRRSCTRTPPVAASPLPIVGHFLNPAHINGLVVGQTLQGFEAVIVLPI